MPTIHSKPRWQPFSSPGCLGLVGRPGLLEQLELEQLEIVVREPPVMVPVELVEFAGQLRPILCVLPGDEAIVITIKAQELLVNLFLVLWTGLLEQLEILVRGPPVLVPVEFAGQLRPILCVLPADEAIVISIKVLELLGNLFLVLQVHPKKVVQAQHHAPEQDEPDPVLAMDIAESLPRVGKDKKGSAGHEKWRKDRRQYRQPFDRGIHSNLIERQFIKLLRNSPSCRRNVQLCYAPPQAPRRH